MFDSFGIANVEHVVAANECLADVALALAIYPFLSVEQLKVHVAVECNQSAFVLHAPLEFDDHRLVDKVDKEWLGVDGNRLSVHLLPLLRWATACRCTRHFSVSKFNLINFFD